MNNFYNDTSKFAYIHSNILSTLKCITLSKKDKIIINNSIIENNKEFLISYLINNIKIFSGHKYSFIKNDDKFFNRKVKSVISELYTNNMAEVYDELIKLLAYLPNFDIDNIIVIETNYNFYNDVKFYIIVELDDMEI